MRANVTSSSWRPGCTSESYRPREAGTMPPPSDEANAAYPLYKRDRENRLNNNSAAPSIQSSSIERDALLAVARRMGFPRDQDFVYIGSLKFSSGAEWLKSLTTRQISLWIAARDLTRTMVRDEAGDRVLPTAEMWEVLSLVGHVFKPEYDKGSYFGDGVRFYSRNYESIQERHEAFERLAVELGQRAESWERGVVYA